MADGGFCGTPDLNGSRRRELWSFSTAKANCKSAFPRYCSGSCFASRVDVSELGGFAFGDVLGLLGRHAMTIELIGADSKYMSHQCKN